MAFLGEEFSTETLPSGDDGGFELLPPGWYSSVVAGAELKYTKSGTGQYIAIRYDITGPTHQGRVVFGNLNIRNQNAEAERIGLEQLNSLMRAIDLTKVRDTDQLIGGRCQIKLVIKDDKTGQYEPRNEVRGWKAPAGSGGIVLTPQSKLSALIHPQAKPPQQPASPQPASPQRAAPPWVKKTAPAQEMPPKADDEDLPF